MDLSVGATAALASVVAAKVMASATEAYGFDPGVAMVLGILSSLGSAAAVGLLNGLCSALLRVPSLIVTLGTLSIVSGITLMMTSGMPVYGLPRGFIADFGRALWWGVPAPAYVAVAVVAVVCLVQRKTVLGTYIYAIGGNPLAAIVSGYLGDLLRGPHVCIVRTAGERNRPSHHCSNGLGADQSWRRPPDAP